VELIVQPDPHDVVGEMGVRGACSCWLYLPLNDDRERESKSRALARLGLDPDFTPMHLNDAFRYGKA
jgi:hypothetical protein